MGALKALPHSTSIFTGSRPHSLAISNHRSEKAPFTRWSERRRTRLRTHASMTPVADAVITKTGRSVLKIALRPGWQAS